MRPHQGSDALLAARLIQQLFVHAMNISMGTDSTVLHAQLVMQMRIHLGSVMQGLITTMYHADVMMAITVMDCSV